jgi:general secretion pathway protein E
MQMEHQEIGKGMIYEAMGCPECNGQGYRGRTGIYELVIIDDKLRQMIHHNENIHSMETYIRPKTPSIRQDGFRRVLMGDTSIAEILRVSSDLGG